MAPPSINVIAWGNHCGTGPVQAGRAVDGVTLSAAQLGNAEVIYDVPVTMGLPQRAAVIAEATAVQESHLVNLPGGTSDSLWLFQQRPSQGWGTPEQVRALPLTVAAQDVQGSSYPMYAAGTVNLHAP